MMRTALLLVVLAACGGRSEPRSPAAPPSLSQSSAAAPAHTVAPVPVAPTCASTAERMVSLLGDGAPDDLPAERRARWRARYIADVADACNEARWPPAYMTCIRDAASAPAAIACDKLMDEETRARSVASMASMSADDVTEHIAERSPAGRDDVAPSDLPDEAWLAALRKRRTGVVECDRYLATLADYLACDRVDRQARAALKRGLGSIEPAFERLLDPTVPAEAKRVVTDACTEGHKVFLESAQALGCKVTRTAP
jgi:hypothetical protein